MQDNGQSTCNSPFTSSSSCGFYPFPDRLALSHFTAHICQKSAKLISSWINSWKFETNVRWRNLSYSNWDIKFLPERINRSFDVSGKFTNLPVDIYLVHVWPFFKNLFVCHDLLLNLWKYAQTSYDAKIDRVRFEIWLLASGFWIWKC